MTEIIVNVLESSWDILLDSALYILFGFFVAGVLKVFIPDNVISKHLGKGKLSSVLKTSIIGIPLPLCSCGVVPAAAGLKKQGASKGAVSSFLISTPETGMDSIVITYALLDPLMTVIRPIAALFTAFFSGLFVNMFDKNETENFHEDAVLSASCNSNCCSTEDHSLPVEKHSFFTKFKSGMKFAFFDLVDDIGLWFIVGILISGLITVFISPDIIDTYFGDGFFPMLLMLVLAVPFYVCAISSTPIAAALAMKGLAPGAILVFLLAGPATNSASITAILKILGKKATMVYLSVIIVCSLIMGGFVNYLYKMSGYDITNWIQNPGTEEHSVFSMICSLVLIGLVLRIIPSKLRSIRANIKNKFM